MALVSTHIIPAPAGQKSNHTAPDVLAFPSLLRCLIISWSDKRTQLLQSAAEDERWQVKVASDVQDFLRSVFLEGMPLTIVDMPPKHLPSYAKIKEVTAHTSEVGRSLLIVCGAENDQDEEMWVRQLGAWAYLPEATNTEGLGVVFAEARKALAKQSTTYVEASGYR